MLFHTFLDLRTYPRAVVTGGGGLVPLPDCNGSVDPISTTGAHYAHHITVSSRIFRPSYGSEYEVVVFT